MSHYSKAFKRQTFVETCEMIASDVRDQFLEASNKAYPLLCYSGFSGTTSATLISSFLTQMRFRHEHCYIRKENETSHGERIETSSFSLDDRAVPVFVDDFIASGSTINYVMGQVCDNWCWKEESLPGFRSLFAAFKKADFRREFLTIHKGMYSVESTFVEEVGIILTGKATHSSDTYRVDLRPYLWADEINDYDPMETGVI